MAQIGLQQQFVQTGLLVGFGGVVVAVACSCGHARKSGAWELVGAVWGGGGAGGGAQTLCSPVAASLRPAPPLLACLCSVEA